MKGLLVKTYMTIQSGVEKILSVNGKFSYVRMIALLVILHGILHLSIFFSILGLAIGLFCFAAEKFGNDMANSVPAV